MLVSNGLFKKRYENLSCTIVIGIIYNQICNDGTQYYSTSLVVSNFLLISERNY